MNMIIKGVTYTLTEEANTVYGVCYDVFKGTNLIGSITRVGVEIHYTARDTQGEVRGCAGTLRKTLEEMVDRMYYYHPYKGDRYLETFGTWIEGERVKVEYDKDGVVKKGERVVRYSKAAGDLYITIDNNKYFYCEFE